VVEHRAKADASNAQHVGAPMPGMIVDVAVKVGDQVAKGAKLLTLEAMKMQTTLYAERDGRVAELTVQPGISVETGDLVVRWE
jgi:pyruvate carboxylase